MDRQTACHSQIDIVRMKMSAGHAAAGGLHCVSILQKRSAPQRLQPPGHPAGCSTGPGPEQAHRHFEAMLAKLQSATRLGKPAGDSVTPAGYGLLARLILNDATWDATGDFGGDPVSGSGSGSLRGLLGLDSLYGQRSTLSPEFCDESGIRFRIGLTEISGGAGHSSRHLPHDLPRDTDGRAIIADRRNDDSLLFSQFIQIWMKLHNVIADRLAAHDCPQPATEARKLVVRHFHRVILNDFMPRIASAALKPRAGDLTIQTRPTRPTRPTRDEWVMAMQCVWPCTQRLSYELNQNFVEKPVDSGQLEALTGDGGIAPVPSNWIIDWRRFFSFRSTPARTDDSVHYNRSTKLDLTAVSTANPSFASAAMERSLTRMENARQICTRFGVVPLSDQKIRASLPPSLAAWLDETGLKSQMPLWLYLMIEAAVEQNGNRPGTLGATIIRNGILAQLPQGADDRAERLPDFPGRDNVLALPLTDGNPARSIAELIAMIDAATPLLSPLDDARYGD